MILTTLDILRKVGALKLVVTFLLVFSTTKLALTLLKRRKLANLRGPPNPSFLFGRTAEVRPGADRALKYGEWAKEYGPIYKVPAVLGSENVVVCDVKAAARIHSKDTYSYVLMPFVKTVQERVFGFTMLTAEGDEHKRLRRAMAPAFSVAALRPLTSVFFDSAYKIKTNWDALFESDREVVIDVQKWVNRMTLDVIGIAGFGYDFKSLDGQPSSIIEVFEAFGQRNLSIAAQLLTILAPGIRFPTKRAKLFEKFNTAVAEVANQMLSDERKGRQVSGVAEGRIKDMSILGLLMRGESEDAKVKFSHEEIMAHTLFLSAGYETTAISVTWALIELARHPEVQRKLREELQSFSTSDPNWDQLKSELPFLDAVVHETLRLHPALDIMARMAAEDDVLPLAAPLNSASGEMIDSVTIPKGTTIVLPRAVFNRSEELWGPDAKQFHPDRWLGELTVPAKEIRGHRHLFTFSDGPKICIGKDFALAEFKAALFVLIRNFTFELPDGPDTKIGNHLGIMLRPKVEGEVGSALPMRVRQVAK